MIQFSYNNQDHTSVLIHTYFNPIFFINKGYYVLCLSASLCECVCTCTWYVGGMIMTIHLQKLNIR